MKNKTKIALLVSALIIIFFIFGSFIYINITGYSINKDKETKIGVILPLTGNTAYVGEYVRNGIELAAEDLRKQGKEINLIYEDDACNPENAVSALNKLIKADNLGVILGPVCSSSVLSASPIAEKDKVILFSSVATSNKITQAGDYIFRDRESDGLHGEIMAEFAYNSLRAKKVAIIFLNLDNGIGFKESFKNKFTELGGKVVAEESFESKDIDFRTQLSKIKEANPDVLYFAGQKMENIVIQARELGLNQQILGPSTIQADSLIKAAGELADGIIYTYPDFNPDAKQTTAYNNEYQAKYNKTSEAYSANSYDALMILYKAIEKCKDNSYCIKTYLYSIKNYQGVSGTFSIDSNGDVQRELMIKTIKDGKFVNY